jgi:hypothetical protein
VGVKLGSRSKKACGIVGSERIKKPAHTFPLCTCTTLAAAARATSNIPRTWTGIGKVCPFECRDIPSARILGCDVGQLEEITKPLFSKISHRHTPNTLQDHPRHAASNYKHTQHPTPHHTALQAHPETHHRTTRHVHLNVGSRRLSLYPQVCNISIYIYMPEFQNGGLGMMSQGGEREP